MSISQQEFSEFTNFAQARLCAGGAESIEQLAQQWRKSRELTRLIDDIAQSEADIQAGRVHSSDEVFAGIREKLGLKK